MSPRVLLHLLPCLLALLLCAPASHAAAPKKTTKKSADTVKRVTLVIWGGGKTPADAERAVKDFTERGFRSSAPPVQLFSTEVRGLNPGFHIAVLGACPPAQGHALLRRVRQFYPGVYVRAVPAEGAVAKLSCPIVNTPRREWYYEPGQDEPAVISGSEEIVVPGGTLQVEAEATVESNSEFVSASYAVTARLKKNGQVIDEWTHQQPDYATIDDLTLDSKAKAVVLTSHDAISDCKSDTFYEVLLTTRRFSVKDGKIVVTDKITGRESGVCGPQYEGSTPCSLARQTAQYNAVRGACENASREDCMKAIDEYEADAEEIECDEYGGVE